MFSAKITIYSRIFVEERRGNAAQEIQKGEFSAGAMLGAQWDGMQLSVCL